MLRFALCWEERLPGIVEPKKGCPVNNDARHGDNETAIETSYAGLHVNKSSAAGQACTSPSTSSSFARRRVLAPEKGKEVLSDVA